MQEGVLTEADLDLIATFGGLLLTRHPNKTNSHSVGVSACGHGSKQIAGLWGEALLTCTASMAE